MMTYRDLIKSSLGENGSEEFPDIVIPELALGIAALLCQIAYTACLMAPGYSINGAEFPKNDNPDYIDIISVLGGDDLLRRTTIYLQLKEFLEWLMNREPEEDGVWESYEGLLEQWNRFAKIKMNQEEGRK